MPKVIGTLTDLSVLCLYDACPECFHVDCLCVCHETDDLEPLRFDDAADDASILHAEARFEASRDD